ncbi:MAG: sugar transferase [Eggerthellaceae bacterium]|nr:sugar transferase [Eggerthellaceae bacterium]
MYVRFVKRIFDIGIGLVALPVVGVFTIVCGVRIKAEDGGPIFYNAPRVGKNGREFTMYKFRSMKVNAPDLVFSDGSTYNSADDPRMTRVGAWMRRTSVDELPQFLNVLGGSMSVVGPRPDLKRETELYVGNEAEKLLVKPGITGYAAVYGGRNASLWHDRLALDVWYVHHVSFLLDARIFFKTFGAIFSQKGIYADSGDALGSTHDAHALSSAVAPPLVGENPVDNASLAHEDVTEKED